MRHLHLLLRHLRLLHQIIRLLLLLVCCWLRLLEGRVWLGEIGLGRISRRKLLRLLLRISRRKLLLLLLLLLLRISRRRLQRLALVLLRGRLLSVRRHAVLPRHGADAHGSEVWRGEATTQHLPSVY